MICNNSKLMPPTSEFDLDAMYDPINMEKFTNPIMCPHGHTYEEGTLRQKIDEQGNKLLQCAFSGHYFPAKDYRVNYIVKDFTEIIEKLMRYKEVVDENGKFSREKFEKIITENKEMSAALKKQGKELEEHKNQISNLKQLLQSSELSTEKMKVELVKERTDRLERQLKYEEYVKTNDRNYDLLKEEMGKIKNQASFSFQAKMAAAVAGVVFVAYKFLQIEKES